MKAVRHVGYKTFPELKEVEKPTPGPGEVLLKVAGAGLCHSDVAIFNEFEEGQNPPLDPEFTLGHESSGWAEEIGEGVVGINKGDAFLVYGPKGCGRCKACSKGQDTYCENAASIDTLGYGLGRDGGVAEYMLVDARNLVPLGDCDPIAAAPLSDAGLTPYHAIKMALPHLSGGGKYALVIGLGGLGLMGVQILKALTGATIIATDVKEESRKEAEALGCITVSGDDQVAQIREITGGRGVDAAFDFVGIGKTVEVAVKSAAVQSRIQIVGIGDLSPYQWSFLTTPYEAELVNSYWGTIAELNEVVDMFKAGQLKPQITTYPLDQALEAYQALVDGKISGRAVVVPHGTKA